jgi:hypothetical protein
MTLFHCDEYNHCYWKKWKYLIWNYLISKRAKIDGSNAPAGAKTEHRTQGIHSLYLLQWNRSSCHLLSHPLFFFMKYLIRYLELMSYGFGEEFSESGGAIESCVVVCSSEYARWTCSIGGAYYLRQAAHHRQQVSEMMKGVHEREHFAIQYTKFRAVLLVVWYHILFG